MSKDTSTMDPKLGFDILINDTPRTFRDRKETAYEAARLVQTHDGRP